MQFAIDIDFSANNAFLTVRKDRVFAIFCIRPESMRERFNNPYTLAVCASDAESKSQTRINLTPENKVCAPIDGIIDAFSQKYLHADFASIRSDVFAHVGLQLTDEEFQFMNCIFSRAINHVHAIAARK